MNESGLVASGNEPVASLVSALVNWDYDRSPALEDEVVGIFNAGTICSSVGPFWGFVLPLLVRTSAQLTSSFLCESSWGFGSEAEYLGTNQQL